MELPKRKSIRLRKYDYSAAGAYFVTICTCHRQNLFWSGVGAGIARPQDVPLTPYGKLVKQSVLEIPHRYPAIAVDHYVIMPNHIHLLLRIQTEGGRAMLAPTISVIVQQMKGAVTKQAGCPVWQKSFHDHVIRGEADYREIWDYIEHNPLKWKEDRFYIP